MIVFIYFFEKMNLLRDVIIGNQTELQVYNISYALGIIIKTIFTWFECM